MVLIRRSAKVALQIAAVAFVALAVVAGIMIWQATQGPVSLGLLSPRLEAMINDGLKDIQLRFGDSVIEWSEGKNLAHLQFVDVQVLDRNDAVIARVPRANVSLSGPALLRGEIAPTRVELVGARTLLVRRSDGGVQLGFQVDAQDSADEARRATSPGVTRAVLQAMLSPKPNDTLSRYLKHFAVRDAKLTVFDEATKSYWSAEGAALSFERLADGVAATVTAPVRLADKSTWLFTASGRYVNGQPDIAIEAAFKSVHLSLLAASGSGLKALAGLDVPVQGNASCNLKIAGDLGRCRLWLNAGAGLLKLPALKKEPIVLKSAALTAEIDVPTGRYQIEQLTWAAKTNRGQVSGAGGFAFAADGALAQLSAELTAENISIDAPNVFDGQVALERLAFRGLYDGTNARLLVDEIHARRGPFDLKVTGEIVDHPVSTGVTLNGQFANLGVQDLKRLWPAGSAPGARAWVLENMHDGMVRTGTIAVNIPPGAVGEEGIPDETMNIALALEGARVTYLAGLPDVAKVSGTATVSGDTFRADIASGAIGQISVKNATILIPQLHRHATIGTVEGELAGPTAHILSVLDQPRLGYPTRYGIKAAAAGGTSAVKFKFDIPMLAALKAEDVVLAVESESKDVRLPINDQLKLTGGTFAVKLDSAGLKAHGAVLVNGAPMGFTWTEDFTGTAAVGTRLDVTATLDNEHRKGLGLDALPYVEGKSTIVAAFTGEGGKIRKARVDANLAAARLSVPQLNWVKPEGDNAKLKADIVFRPDGKIEIANIDAAGQGLRASGRLVIAGGKIREADFKRLHLGLRNDFALRYRDDGAQTLEAKGRVADLGDVFDDDHEPQAPAQHHRKTPLTIKANLELAYMKADIWFAGLKLDYGDDGQRLTAFNVEASADAAKLRGELVRSADGARRLKLHTADAGRLLRGLTGFRSLIGGQLSMTAELSPMPSASPQTPAEPTFDGVLKVEQFKVVNQPFLARLLAAGSFTGLDDLLRGEGVTFTKLEQQFQGRGGMITLTDGRAAGPSIGLTAQGMINRTTDRLDLNGTIVPLYGLNSMFEGVPLLGDLLTSRQGEGIFGVTYGISGPVDELKIAVNPISMLTPGIFRRIFQMGPTPQTAAPMPLPQPKPETPGLMPSGGTN